MMVRVYGAAVYGVEAIPICIEVNADRGIAYHLVGLPDSAIKESGYRISAALKNSGFRMPGKKITINLSPADLRKEGAAYDLVMAVGILAASKQIESHGLDNYLMMGELSLDGQLRSIRGVLPIVEMARELGYEGVILPRVNQQEAEIISDIRVIGANSLQEVIGFLRDPKAWRAIDLSPPGDGAISSSDIDLDFEDVKGQETAKRCLEIAAAGGHNVLMIGPPGSGKTMLAKRLSSILPELSSMEALETTKIHSVAGKIRSEYGILRKRPFRAPHHTISPAALVGGGSYPQPGEISLAHNGVLFLDELPEFKRNVLEVLRQPLEDREVTLSRARFTISYPSSFMLIASMNPNRKGHFDEEEGGISMRDHNSIRYMNRISGPLMDRIDLQIEVPAVEFDKMTSEGRPESSEVIRQRVSDARGIQKRRFSENSGVHCNAQMQVKLMQRHCKLDSTSKSLIRKAMKKLRLSARAYDRILKVSRTIADLDKKEQILPVHISEAIQYRSLDRKGLLG